MDRREGERRRDENHLGAVFDEGEQLYESMEEAPVESADIQSLLNKVAELNAERASVAEKYGLRLDSNSESSSQYEAPLTREAAAATEDEAELSGLLKTFATELQSLSQAFIRLDQRLSRLELAEESKSRKAGAAAPDAGAVVSSAEGRRHHRNHRETEEAIDRRDLEELFKEQTVQTESFLRHAADHLLDPRSTLSGRSRSVQSQSTASRHHHHHHQQHQHQQHRAPLDRLPAVAQRKSLHEHKADPVSFVTPPPPFLAGALSGSKNTFAYREDRARLAVSPSWHLDNQIALVQDEIADLDQAYHDLISRGADKSVRGIAHLAQVVEMIESKRIALETLMKLKTSNSPGIRSRR